MLSAVVSLVVGIVLAVAGGIVGLAVFKVSIVVIFFSLRRALVGLHCVVFRSNRGRISRQREVLMVEQSTP